MTGYPREPEREDTDVIGARIGAQIVDNIAMAVIFMVVLIIFGGVGGGLDALTQSPGAAGATGGFLFFGFFIGAIAIVFYAFLLEGYWDGQTLGKKLFGVKVVKENGDQCDYGSAFVRNIPAFITVIPFFGGILYITAIIVGFIAMAISDNRQRVFDRLGGTVVVREAE